MKQILVLAVTNKVVTIGHKPIFLQKWNCHYLGFPNVGDSIYGDFALRNDAPKPMPCLYFIWFPV